MGCTSSSGGVAYTSAEDTERQLRADQEVQEQKVPPKMGTEQELVSSHPNLLSSIKAQKATRDNPPETKFISRKPYMNSVDALRDMLEAKGVSTSGFGSGASKSLEDLLAELESSACYFEVDDDLGRGMADEPRILRVVQPVYIRLCWRGLFLVQELRDGRRRTNRFFLSDKKRSRDRGGLFSTIIRIIHEELAIPKKELLADGVLLYRPDTYSFEVERLDSSSYPGLPSEYRTHYVQVDILESGLQAFKHCGLADCRDFSLPAKSASKDGELKTHTWRWYTVENAMHSGIIKFPPEALVAKVERERVRLHDGTRIVYASEFRDTAALSRLLERSEVDLEKVNSGSALLHALWKELQAGESILEMCQASQRLRLVTEPVFVEVRWGEKVCVEVESSFTSGSCKSGRARYALLATSKVTRDGDMFTAAVRGLAEKFKMPEDSIVLNETVRFRADQYCCIAEHMVSESYPGLPCIKVTHYCRVDILEAGLKHFRSRGLPNGDPFTLTDKDKATSWQWRDVKEARMQDVKGFPDVGEACGEPDEINYALYKPVQTTNIDISMLRNVLEMGEVWPSTWGEFENVVLASLLWELKTGFSSLEVHEETGKVRRVLEPTLVHATVHGNDLEEHGLGAQKAKESLIYRSDIAKFEIVHADVLSYPGLPCVHQTGTLQFEQVPDSATCSL